MTAKEYLMQLQQLDIKICQKMAERNRLKASVLGHAINYDADHVQTSPQNAQENTIIKYMGLEERINDMIDLYINKTDKIIDEIHKLDDVRYIKILYDHYVPDERHRVKSLEQIAVDMNYNYTWVCELHGQALNVFAEKNRINPK